MFGDRHIWDRRDGVVTHYGLDNKGTESQWGEIFYTHLDWPWGRHPLQTVLGDSQGYSRQGVTLTTHPI